MRRVHLLTDEYLAMGYTLAQAITFAVQDSVQRDLDAQEPIERSLT